jgi:tetratricopeptide (TPR) repeat protein
MLRRAWLFLVILGISALGHGDREAAAASPSAEQTDLQTAAVAETAVWTESQAGQDTRQGVDRLNQMFVGLEAKYPRSAEVRDEHGNFLWNAKRLDDAFAEWREAEKLDGNNADVCSHLGACFLDNGDTRRGIGYFERAAALDPKDASLHFALGTELYLFRHELVTPERPETAVVDEALAELRRASNLDPLDAEYASGYAETFYSIPVSKWPEALKAWQHFYDVSSNKDLAAMNLARVSLQMKDKASARKYLEKVNGPAFQELKKKLMAQAGE